MHRVNKVQLFRLVEALELQGNQFKAPLQDFKKSYAIATCGAAMNRDTTTLANTEMSWLQFLFRQGMTPTPEQVPSSYFYHLGTALRLPEHMRKVMWPLGTSMK